MGAITILGIGNILLQDEGFGVRVVEELNYRYIFPPGVQVLDGGTLGMELLRFLTGTDKLVIIDAIAGTSSPGTVYEFQNEAVKTYFNNKISMHEFGIQEVLATLDILGNPIKDVVIVGVEPHSINIGLELSPQTVGAVDKVIGRVVSQLIFWQVELMDK